MSHNWVVLISHRSHKTAQVTEIWERFVKASFASICPGAISFLSHLRITPWLKNSWISAILLLYINILTPTMKHGRVRSTTGRWWGHGGLNKPSSSITTCGRQRIVLVLPKILPSLFLSGLTISHSYQRYIWVSVLKGKKKTFLWFDWTKEIKNLKPHNAGFSKLFVWSEEKK